MIREYTPAEPLDAAARALLDAADDPSEVRTGSFGTFLVDEELWEKSGLTSRSELPDVDEVVVDHTDVDVPEVLDGEVRSLEDSITEIGDEDLAKGLALFQAESDRRAGENLTTAPETLVPGAGDSSDTGDQTVDAYDPGEHTVADVQLYLNGDGTDEHPAASDDERERVLAAERAGKNRSSLVG